jgi:hypothetical protein
MDSTARLVCYPELKPDKCFQQDVAKTCTATVTNLYESETETHCLGNGRMLKIRNMLQRMQDVKIRNTLQRMQDVKDKEHAAAYAGC